MYISRTKNGAGLDPSNPQTTDVAEETLDLRHPEFSSGESLLIPAFSLPPAPTNLTIYLHCRRDAPLPPAIGGIPSSVDNLVPIIFGATYLSRQRRDYLGELLRTLLRMAASEPTSLLC